MKIPRAVFREYDVRGLIGSELTLEFAEHLGRAFGSTAIDHVGTGARIAVGCDNRPSSGGFAEALRRGILSTGASVVDVGSLPTPALYYAVQALGTDGGVQVTGSHNPPEFNGFKFVLAGESLHGPSIAALGDRIEAEQYRTGSGRQESNDTVLARYRAAIVERHTLRRPVRVAVDCGNGVMSLVAIETLRDLGAEVIPLFAESDGTFPNHHPDPTVAANLVDLQRVVREEQAELGIAFDGDGDRIGAVDEHTRPIWGDQLLVVFGRDAVRRFGEGAAVIFDVKCSEVLPQALTAAGARPVIWKTGHSLIEAKMKEERAPLAGEMSGHIFFGGDWFGFDDALFAAARLLEIVSHGPSGVAALLADLPTTYATPELRVACDDARKFALVDEAIAYFGARYPVVTIDGVRITYPDGWGLIRASNTQPVLVLRFEGTTPEARDAHHAELMEWLAARGVRG
ncbi:MAG TPA: phosphomannomutase/phosphoglucomutase [Gemmatimonadales bacterium]|jgi:phosphomannomutase/phosphoglucomutase